jgi:hypothetical protein
MLIESWDEILPLPRQVRDQRADARLLQALLRLGRAGRRRLSRALLEQEVADRCSRRRVPCARVGARGRMSLPLAWPGSGTKA